MIAHGSTLGADSPKSLLPVFGNHGAKFTAAAKDGHALQGWLPIGWTDNSDWAAVNATYIKLTDSPDKDAGAVRIKVDDLDDGQLQFTSFAGNQEYKKGRNYVVTGWVRSPDHIQVRVGDREIEEPHEFGLEAVRVFLHAGDGLQRVGDVCRQRTGKRGSGWNRREREALKRRLDFGIRFRAKETRARQMSHFRHPGFDC
jgi:hypothetical protein